MFVSVENIDTLQSEKFISESAFAEEFKVYPQFGDVLMTRIGDIGTANVMRSDDRLAYYVSLALLKPNDLDSDFLATLINSPSVQNEMWQRTLHVAFPKKINKGEIEKIGVSVPDTTEQTAIGNLFRTLDDTITLHKRKLDGLKELKSGYLQVMLPQNGETVPRMRFAGFEGEWKERKLGEVLTKNSEKNKDNTISNVESVSNKFGFVKQEDYFEDRQIASKDTSNYYVIRNGAFAFNPSRINVGSIALKDNDVVSVVSPLYISFYPQSEINSIFLWNWFKTCEFEKGRRFLTAGGVRDTLSYEALQEMPITFPSIDEQIPIGIFFRNLDEQIADQAEKVEQLKQLKSAYLQKMFV